MRIRLANFGGEIPGVHERLLPENNAQIAQDVRLYRGDLHPTRRAAFETDVASGSASFFRYQDEWHAFEGDVDMAPGPVADDRIYYTGDGAPKMRVGDTIYGLALDAPATQPTLALVAGGSGLNDPLLQEDVLYAYTWVTSFGEESKPSLTRTITWEPGNVVRVNGFEAPPANRAVTKIRIYRSQTSAAGLTDLFFVDEIDVGLNQYDHDIELAPLQEIIPSSSYDTPVEGLSGITVMPNGMMAAFEGKDLYFCEPYLPHAWPAAYRLTTDDPIVALVAFGSLLAVLTTGVPYMVQGTDPSTLIMEKSDQALPCVSGRGAVDLGYAALYPSVEGLVMIDGNGGRLLSSRLFTREQWAKMNPATFRASEFNGRYMFSYFPSGKGAREIGLIDMAGEVPSFIRSTEYADAVWHDRSTKETFLLRNNGQIWLWEALDSSLKNLLWRSKLIQMTASMSFSALLIEGDETDPPTPSELTVRVFADGNEITSQHNINRVLRLPARRAVRWEIEVETNMTITAISMATSVEELAAGP